MLFVQKIWKKEHKRNINQDNIPKWNELRINSPKHDSPEHDSLAAIKLPRRIG